MYTTAINYASLFQKLFEEVTDEPRFAVLHNTWRIGGAPVGRHLVGFGSVNCKPVNQNFCLKVDFVYLLTICLKVGIVPTREITTKIEKTSFFSSVAMGLFLEWA